MFPRDIGGQDPEPVAGAAGVQRRVDSQASVQDEPDIAAEVADRAPRPLRHSRPHPQLPHPPRQIRCIPGGTAGQYRGHGHHVGLLPTVRRR
ncbi:hypothetical protein ACWD25_21055 [Streptomyces sp. NPDC002920]